jgi:methylphosphotriester-DNA--protein-cysteine methyltransferase
MARGRPPLGPRLANGLEGSEHARKCLEIILETISGERTVAQACEALGISEAAFHKLRSKVLQAALVALEPKPAGRPRKEVPAGQTRVEEIERELKMMELQLFASQVREEIALAMPHLYKDRKDPEKKGMAKKRRKKRAKGK